MANIVEYIKARQQAMSIVKVFRCCRPEVSAIMTQSNKIAVNFVFRSKRPTNKIISMLAQNRDILSKKWPPKNEYWIEIKEGFTVYSINSLFFSEAVITEEDELLLKFIGQGTRKPRIC